MRDDRAIREAIKEQRLSDNLHSVSPSLAPPPKLCAERKQTQEEQREGVAVNRILMPLV
jgi:hypothetical protein